MSYNRRIHRLSRLLLVCALVVQSAGCSRLVIFEVRGTVKDATTRAPIKGVSITLHSEPDVGRISPSMPIATDQDGQFSFELRVVDQSVIHKQPKWSLRLAKEGYETESVDLTPDPKRLPGGTPGQILVVMHLTPRHSGVPGGEN